MNGGRRYCPHTKEISESIHDCLALLHRAYNAEPPSPCKSVPSSIVVESLANKLVIRHGMTVNFSITEQVIISFSH
jgi:hypothetical protein